MPSNFSIVPTTRTVNKGDDASYQVTALGDWAYLGVVGLPGGVVPAFGANPLGANDTTGMIIATSSFNPGTFALELIGGQVGFPHYAASPALADVQAAIASASDGDTVIIPAGSATWTSNLVITKYIVLKGSGYANTIITSGYTGTGNQFDTSYYLVSFNPSSPALGQPFRITGFTIDGNNNCAPLFLKNDNVTFVNRVRVDHMRTYGRNKNASLWIKGHVWGVADHNILDGGYISVDFYDQVTWSNYNYDFGTANAFYFEDNNIIGGTGSGGGNVIRSEEGAMWVARYNTFDCSTMTNGLYPWFDGHGNGTGHWSVMGVEIYENAVVNAPPAQGASIGQRGGKFLVFNNTCNIYLQEQIWEEFNDNVYGPPIASPNGQPQHCSDSYYWNIRGSNGRKDVIYTDYQIDYGGDVGVVPRPDHTFWQENAAAFDGSSGVGFGLRSARPGSCTLEGAAYWATDERKLYRWHSGAWELYYTPYTYPHPLISDPIIGD